MLAKKDIFPAGACLFSAETSGSRKYGCFRWLESRNCRVDHYFSNVLVFHTLGQLMIVVEFAEHGNLHRYLRDHRKQNYDDINKYSLDISSAERLRIACDVAEGMKHLATMRVLYKFFHTLYMLE